MMVIFIQVKNESLNIYTDMNEESFFELHPDAAVIFDKETLRIMHANKAFCERYGIEAEEISQQKITLEDLHPEEDLPELRSFLDTNNGRPLFDSDIWTHRSHAGDFFDVRISSRSITYEGRPASLASLVNITAILQQETDASISLPQQTLASLKRNEVLFKKLFSNAPQAIAMVDAGNKILKVNNSFESLFGYTANELLGRTFNEVIRAAEGAEKAPKIDDHSSNEHDHIYREVERYTKDGKKLSVIVGGIPVFMDGELIAGFGIYIDITGQKIVQQKLEQSLGEKQVLLEEVHHRVKNNLAVISGLLQMQILHVDDERLSRYIQNSQLRIQSMAIVHEMLYKSETLSQIQMDEYVKKLSEVISSTLVPDNKPFTTIAESDAIVLNVNQAIPCALIISELITNAYEYAFEGRENGNIKVNLSQDGDKILVFVKDDGIGLPDKFEELRTKSLGISLIENLCAQLETKIEIDSGDWGTRFAFTFIKNETAGSSSSNRV